MTIVKHHNSNQLRIIGGKLRRSKIVFQNVTGLRPTPDRVRETLFNWLQNDIESAMCLDLFAGSGALGLECISRGAEFVSFVEQNSNAAYCIESNLNRLKINNGIVVCQDVIQYLQRNTTAKKFQLVFLDPPYSLNVLAECMQLLEQKNWLAPKAKIYLETASHCSLELPDRWTLYKHKKGGQVGYHLAIRDVI